jgi:hypothetical protein
MVLLVIDPESVPEAMALAKQLGCAIWVGSDGVTEDEYQLYGASGIKISRFIYLLADADELVLSDARETIGEHHPSEIIWVQCMRTPK